MFEENEEQHVPLTVQAAEIFYQGDLIRIGKGELQIDLLRSFLNPALIIALSDLASKILDDYAIDAIVANDETLPFAPQICARLELPMIWLRGDDWIGPSKNIERVMTLRLISPEADDLAKVKARIEKEGLELSGVFSFLQTGVLRQQEVRQVCLTDLAKVMEIYAGLHLISEEELSRIKNQIAQRGADA